MENNLSELNQWKEYFINNKFISKELNKYDENELDKTDFFSDWKIIENKFVVSYGAGYSKLNEISLRRIFVAFLEMIKSQNNEYILIASDGFDNNDLIKSLTKLDLNEKVKLLAFDGFNEYDKKFIHSSYNLISPKAGIYLQKSLKDNSLINIYLLNEKGENFSNEFLNKIQSKSKLINIFKLPILSKGKVYFIDDQACIKIFIDKVLETTKDQKNSSNTKITVSNHNKGVTEILTKMIAKLDYSYVINKKPKNKNIYLHDYLDEKMIKKIYRDEINFARKRQSNLLFTFNESGTNLLVFLIYKNKVIFLNENLISLIFLHNFMNNMAKENKKIENIHIASNLYPIKSIDSLIKKYHINYKFEELPQIHENSQLLYYWNTNNQYVFGESKNIEFGIYYLSIKLLGIIDYYNSQNANINTLLSSINIMYGCFDETKVKLRINLDKIQENMNRMLVSKDIWNKHSIVNIYKHAYNSEEEEENLLYTIIIQNESSFIIKYNNFLNKAFCFYRYPISNKFKLNYLSKRYKIHKLIKSLFN